jgi:predicted TIM-barrel fold metal-dependent hydrolase
MTRRLLDTKQYLGRFDEPGVVDCDGHVFEPPDLWQNYMEPSWRDRGFKYAQDNGRIVTLLDNKPYKPFEALGAVSEEQASDLFPTDRRDGNLAMTEVKQNGTPTMNNSTMSMMGRPMPFGAMDARERIELLDAEGIEVAILYPTMNLIWQVVVKDVGLAMALARAYNRWIEDFCKDAGGRLVPIAHLVIDDAEGSARELQRAVSNGARGGMIVNFTLSRKPIGHPDHYPLFAKACELNVPISLHPTLEPRWTSPFTRFDLDGRSDAMGALYFQTEQQAFASMFASDVFERFPSLKFGILEAGAGWIGHVLDRMDTLFENSKKSYPGLKRPPSEYFRRHCFISADPDERALAGIIPMVGEDHFMWATDYPHPDHDPSYVNNMKRLTSTLSPKARQKLLGDNAKRIFGIKGTMVSRPMTDPTYECAAAR